MVWMPQAPLSSRPLPYRRNRDDAGEVVVGYMFLGAERRVAFVDRTVETLWGISADELRKRPGLWLARVHLDDRASLEEAWEGSHGGRWNLEYRVVRPDDAMSWVHDEGAMVSAEGRQIYGRVVDITRRRRLEDRLRFQAQLLDVVGQAVLAADQDGRITYWNRAAESLYGLPAEEAAGRSLLAVTIGGEQRSQVADILSRCLDGEGWSGQLWVRRQRGADVPALVTLSPLTGDDGAVLGVVSVAIDVSERVRAEGRFSASEERSRALVEKLRRLTTHLQVVREQEQTRIAREVHDELGQIVTGIKLEVAWLQRRSAPGRPGLAGERLRERLDRVAELADETLAAVHQISMQLRPRVLDDLGLATAIEWAAKDFETRTGIPCTVHCDLDGLEPVGDRDTAAFRIVQEALTNVARHAEATSASLKAVAADGVLTLEVLDDGKGVPASALRAATSLGLAGMRERALAWGGKLAVRRLADDRGTLVAARLPLQAAARASKGEAT